jgi:hypothetical protein
VLGGTEETHEKIVFENISVKKPKKGFVTLFCHVMRGMFKISLNRTISYPATLEIKVELYLDNVINFMLCVGE